jgi:hypothetical protein
MSIFDGFGSEGLGSVTLPGEKELRLGHVPGRMLDPARAERVHQGEALQIENKVKKEELREKIEFLSSQVDRYIATLATLKGQHVSGEKIEDMGKGIKHGMDMQKKLEQELADLG